MSEFDQDQVVALLGATNDAPPDAVDAIQRIGLRCLLDGAPVAAAGISDESGIPLDEIEAALVGLDRAGRLEMDGHAIVGVGGLTLSTTIHSLRLADSSFHTWCALDAIGIPVALGLDASMSTTCPQCSAQLSVEVQDGEATTQGEPILLCPTGPCDDVRADFCSSANLFCSVDHIQAWQSGHPDVAGESLDLASTANLGRAMWGHYAQPVTGATD